MTKPRKTSVESLEDFIEEKWGDPVPYYSFFADMLPYEDVPAVLFMSFIFHFYCCSCKKGENNGWNLGDITDNIRLSEEQCVEAIEIWEKLGVLKVSEGKDGIEKMCNADVYEVDLEVILDFMERWCYS